MVTSRHICLRHKELMNRQCVDNSCQMHNKIHQLKDKVILYSDIEQGQVEFLVDAGAGAPPGGPPGIVGPWPPLLFLCVIRPLVKS
jgi:hypothetical protein